MSCIPAQSNKILGYFEKKDANAKIACGITDEIIRSIDFGEAKSVALDILNGIIANIPVESETESRRKHSKELQMMINKVKTATLLFERVANIIIIPVLPVHLSKIRIPN